MKLICTLVAAGAVALLATASASSMAPPVLIGTVGPGFTISLKHNGKVFKTLKAGRYTFAISDKASIHNFQIEGPGVEQAITTVSVHGDEDRDHHAQEGQVQVLLRAARELDVRPLQGDVGSRFSSRRERLAAPSSIVHASSSPVGRERIRYGRASQRPMFAMSVRDGFAEPVGCEWKTASS